VAATLLAGQFSAESQNLDLELSKGKWLITVNFLVKDTNENPNIAWVYYGLTANGNSICPSSGHYVSGQYLTSYPRFLQLLTFQRQEKFLLPPKSMALRKLEG